MANALIGSLTLNEKAVISMWRFWRKRPTSSRALPKGLGKPNLSAQDILGAALLYPRFGPSSANWRLMVNQDGLLRQEVQIWGYPEDEFRHEEVQLPAGEVGEIVALAERLGFPNFRDSYEDCQVSDQEGLWIAVRFADKLKTVQAYGPIEVAGAQNDRDMLGLLELWARIHRFAPFPSPYNHPEQLLEGVAKLRALMMEAMGGK
jgi:hypothetical protein